VVIAAPAHRHRSRKRGRPICTRTKHSGCRNAGCGARGRQCVS
jgi:hypothetical protein